MGANKRAKQELQLKTTSVVTGAIRKPAKMGHLYLKRFPDVSKLTPGARRNRSSNPHDVLVDYAPTNRASCKMCGDIIPKGSLRFSLMLQCHAGYKVPAVVHQHCFAQHPECAKLCSRDEVSVAKQVLAQDKDSAFVWTVVDNLIDTEIVSAEENTAPHSAVCWPYSGPREKEPVACASINVTSRLAHYSKVESIPQYQPRL